MKLEDITLNHLKILKTVDDYNSFSKAAKVLGYSQSLISKKVKQLEDYFETRLLQRSPGSISLTSKGKRLVSIVEGVYEDVETLHKEFQNAVFDQASKELTIGTTSLLSAVWFKQYLYRITLCFPEQEIREQVTATTNRFTTSNGCSFDLLISNSSAYQGQHCCNRLQTYQLFLIDFRAESSDSALSVTLPEKIDFSQIILIKEIYQDLQQSNTFAPEVLNRAQVVDHYTDLLNALAKTQKSTILPGFCLAPIRQKHNIVMSQIQGISEYGIYIHVPSSSELLVLAESLVRSFQLEQDALESRPKFYLQTTPGKNLISGAISLRIGLQRDSIGQIIAGYGVAHIADQLRLLSPGHLNFPDLKIDQDLEVKISPFASGELLIRQMKRDEIDICILDDIALLRNGSTFFNGLGFNSKLIGIASYNLSGKDMMIVLPKSSAIESLYDLKHKRISVVFGTNAHRFIIALFDLCGYDIDEECTLINEDSRSASNSLFNGSIDAHVCCKTFAFQLEKHKFVKRLDSAYASHIRLPSIRGIVCRSAIIREYPQSLITYLYYLLIANHWFLSNPMEAARKLSHLATFHPTQILDFFDASSGNRIDPTLKPQWSWLLKTLNRRLENRYGISKFDVDFWVDDYFLRLIYSLLGVDYHFQQVSFSNEFSNSYFV
ncbi:MAG: LysR family transcriptional regulator, partial [Cyanobacteria bacterium J06576_12]